MPHFPFDTPFGYINQPITAATTHIVIGHVVEQLEELAFTIVEVARNSALGLCNAAAYERLGTTMFRVLKDVVYLHRAHDVLVHLAGRITMELVERY